MTFTSFFANDLKSLVHNYNIGIVSDIAGCRAEVDNGLLRRDIEPHRHKRVT